MAQITIPALLDNLEMALHFVELQMESAQCPPAFRNQVELAVEEIFVNIARYAYQPEQGKVTIECLTTEKPCSVTIIFCDEGKPYNPLQRKDPDLHLGVEERPIGGLGILMVKKLMDTVTYEFRDGKNRLTLKKQLA